jgi:hypothetical protein
VDVAALAAGVLSTGDDLLVKMRGMLSSRRMAAGHIRELFDRWVENYHESVCVGGVSLGTGSPGGWGGGGWGGTGRGVAAWLLDTSGSCLTGGWVLSGLWCVLGGVEVKLASLQLGVEQEGAWVEAC